MEETEEGILAKPVVMTKRAPAPRLTSEEQRWLERAKAKIDTINTDLASAKGLTQAEALVAAKAGLIDPKQAWCGPESWQERERAAEKDLRVGRVSSQFESVEELVKYLRLLRDAPPRLTWHPGSLLNTSETAP
jgi:hypothetical protein